jgi:hypothetical protein
LLLREWITTVIPSALSRRAVASPIPDVDPVINATAPELFIPAAFQTLNSADERIRTNGPFVAHDHRYLIRAECQGR